MRKDYLPLTQARKFLLDNFSIDISIDAMRKAAQRGVLQTKQYTSNGPHLCTRAALGNFAKRRRHDGLSRDLHR